MVVFEVPLNTITSALPVFLISIGVADGIHMFSEYRENRIEGLPREKAVCLMLDKLALPVTMTSITTAVGFLSLTVSDIVTDSYVWNFCCQLEHYWQWSFL